MRRERCDGRDERRVRRVRRRPRAISSNLEQPRSISIHIDQSRSTSSNLEQSRAISINLEQSRATLSNLEQPRAIWSNHEQSQAISSNLKQSAAYVARGGAHKRPARFPSRQREQVGVGAGEDEALHGDCEPEDAADQRPVQHRPDAALDHGGAHRVAIKRRAEGGREVEVVHLVEGRRRSTEGRGRSLEGRGRSVEGYGRSLEGRGRPWQAVEGRRQTSLPCSRT